MEDVTPGNTSLVLSVLYEKQGFEFIHAWGETARIAIKMERAVITQGDESEQGFRICSFECQPVGWHFHVTSTLNRTENFESIELHN